MTLRVQQTNFFQTILSITPPGTATISCTDFHKSKSRPDYCPHANAHPQSPNQSTSRPLCSGGRCGPGGYLVVLADHDVEGLLQVGRLVVAHVVLGVQRLLQRREAGQGGARETPTQQN